MVIIIKILILENTGSPSRFSRSWYILNNVFHRMITWITTVILIKVFCGQWRWIKSILITSPAAISTELTMPTLPKRVVYTVHLSWLTDISYFIKRRKIETVNINIWFIFTYQLMTNSQGWQWNKMVTTPYDRYSVPTFISFFNLKILNTGHAFVTNLKKRDRDHFILT